MSGAWRVEPVRELSGFTVEWAAPNDYILSRREMLYEAGEPTLPRVELGRIPLALQLRAGARLGLVRRALRLAYYNVLRRDEDVFVTFNRSVALIRSGAATPVAGLERPFRVLRSACALGADGAVWFGEYVIERELTPLRIYRLDAGSRRAEVAHEFPKGFARHVHGVYADPFDGSLWCLTGDYRDHAKVLRSCDGFETFTTVGAGDESWRAVSMQFRRDGIYYATDAQARQNWIYRIDRGTGARTQVAPLDGPVYYSHRVGDDLFFAVTAEQQRARATLWHLDPDDRCVQLTSFAKDRWPVNQFLPGTIGFPRGAADADSFYFSAVALAAGGPATFRCTRTT